MAIRLTRRTESAPRGPDPFTFQPDPRLVNPHLQTLVGIWLQDENFENAAVRHQVTLPDGDAVVLHDDCPAGWRPQDRSALLVHGLTGDARSPYMIRVAARLNQAGLRTFRMDLRGAGAGKGLARRPYHAGVSGDAASALRFIATLCPDSPTTMIGFSLGANITLKLLGECGTEAPGNLMSAMAICPPVDLKLTARNLLRSLNRIYDRYFVGRRLQQLWTNWRCLPDPPRIDLPHCPRSINELDELIIAPLSGFRSADEYYRLCSAAPLLARIGLPTLILAARDDPLVPFAPLARAALPPSTRLEAPQYGGHVAFIAAAGAPFGRRWMDWRITQWVAQNR